MKGSRFVFAALAAIVATAPAGAQDDPGSLVIASWGGAWGNAIQLGIIDAFEAETGIQVELLPMQNIANSRAAIESGNPPPEDILDTTPPQVVALSRDGLLAPVDYSLFDKETLDALPDHAKHEFGLNWGVFGMGICYDRNTFPNGGPSGWADFWDTEKFPGKRAIPDPVADPQLELPLIADGVPVDKLYPLDLDRGFAKLEELREHILAYPPSPAVSNQMLISGEIAMNVCFTHRMQAIVNSGLNNIVIDFNQTRLQSEAFAVWENAPNKENAMKFLAFAARAEPQARWAQLGYTGPMNPKAFNLIPEQIAAMLPTSPNYNTFVIDDAWYASEAPDGRTMREYVKDLAGAFLAR